MFLTSNLISIQMYDECCVMNIFFFIGEGNADAARAFAGPAVLAKCKGDVALATTIGGDCPLVRCSEVSGEASVGLLTSLEVKRPLDLTLVVARSKNGGPQVTDLVGDQERLGSHKRCLWLLVEEEVASTQFYAKDLTNFYWPFVTVYILLQNVCVCVCNTALLC